MFVLTRKTGQELVIGGTAGNVVVTVLRVTPRTVLLGIKAPKEVRVVRNELAAIVREPANARDNGASLDPVARGDQ